MGIVKYGSGQSEKPNIPSLAEWLEVNSSLALAGTSFQVVKISKSQQYGSYSLQCLAEPTKGFRVNVYSNKDEYVVIEDGFKEWKEKGIVLYVILEDSDWGHWDLGTDESQSCKWGKKGSGFICDKAVNRPSINTPEDELTNK